MSKGNALMSGIGVGAVLGAIAGLALAPKPGKETRAMVGNRTRQLVSRKDYVVEGLSRRFKNGRTAQQVEENVIAEHAATGA